MMIDDKYKGKYNKVPGLKTASGRAAVDNGDDVAEALRGKTVEDLQAVAEQNGLIERWNSWEKQSPGHRRMNLGNCLRVKLRKGETVRIGDVELVVQKG